MSAREFLSGRKLAPGTLLGHRMIAPARLAAYEVLRAVSGGRSDLPTALARVRRD